MNTISSRCGTEHGLISVDQALDRILQHVQPLDTEKLELQNALNRYLAENIYSSINLPLFSQSAVDGYAICAKKVIEPESEFQLIGKIRAGQQVEVQLQAGQAVRIFTGAKIPSGTTTVARQEIVQVINSSRIKIIENLKANIDIRDVGEEIVAGQLLANEGQQLSVGVIASLSMAGINTVEVFQYPKVAIVISGDEVAESVEDFAAGKIFDANGPLIKAWFQQAGQQVEIFHIADTKEAVQALIQKLSSSYDLILTTGGVSVGDYDFIRPVALESGFEQIFWKVKQKPGKPIFFAYLQRNDKSTCYLLGLPGNPAAVYVGMQVYTSTLLNVLQGQKNQPSWFNAVLSHDLKMDARERFLRMYASFDDSVLTVKSLSRQQSHMLSNLMQANCLVRVPAERNLSQGDMVQGLFIQ
ncbi:molybdopterin molybdotransferase MoeA [Acinetobacter radioresistens]|uniref:molybdopterin molybdotransferase MoeA n=1 Tax=Acinetobacter radioresistens TaxID=40216 RepID=UPI000DADFBCE|nr:molybdopterin molybdotransferase MoeA [Acinetobacter radioresistens]AWV86312.1 molybdopterin molybdenumtransferase MoeA [Acinetobacter radioresistens]MCX0328357.1 molybdopterin molybdotransferase MoeA [Acinetobacter radioresistens]